MKPLRVTPDAERKVRDLLVAPLAAKFPTATVGVGVPNTYNPRTSPPYVQVSSDGIPIASFPVSARATMRVCVWSNSTTLSKAIAAYCEGWLLANPSAGGMSGTRQGTGVLATRDADTGAELAYITVGVTFRLIPA